MSSKNAVIVFDFVASLGRPLNFEVKQNLGKPFDYMGECPL